MRVISSLPFSSRRRMRSMLRLRWMPRLALTLIACSGMMHAQITSTITNPTASPTDTPVRMPRLFSSHMVLQRDRPVHLWGWATPGEAVTASFRGETRTATTDELGRWSLYLAPGAAGGPFVLTVAGSLADTDKLLFDDVLVGDLWLAGGQSNMEFEMRKSATAATDLPAAGNDRIRLLTVNKKAADYPQTDFVGIGWTASTPASARDFSAVAWYFAREIEAREHVPVGVIDSTWGGTIAESWTRLTALGDDAALAPVFAVRGQMTDHEATALLEDKLHDQQRAAARAAGKPAPQFPWNPMLDMWAPAMLWNGMIAPLTPFPIRGVLWYQGESNSALARAPLYERLFETLITDWRSQWAEGDFPFLYVQIANFKSTPQEDWATIREAQRRTLKLRHTAMAVTIDIGNPDDVHPTDKVTVGHRLALAARRISYGEAVEDSGPTLRQTTTEGSALRLWFNHATGLHAQGGALTGFELAGSDGVFHPAQASIEGNPEGSTTAIPTILLTSAQVAHPVWARYGWANSPDCHLYNGDGLPASPFTTQP